jgi:hypothetical protein
MSRERKEKQKSSKHQPPEKFQVPTVHDGCFASSNSTARAEVLWILKLDASLEVGAWNLELQYRRSPPCFNPMFCSYVPIFTPAVFSLPLNSSFKCESRVRAISAAGVCG